jgi:hypothetical protein
MRTRFEDAVSVLFANKSLDELDEQERALLAQLVGLEAGERGVSGKALVTKSQGKDVQSYVGPELADVMLNKSQHSQGYSARDVCRRSVGLDDRVSLEGEVLAKSQVPDKGCTIHDLLYLHHPRQASPML